MVERFREPRHRKVAFFFSSERRDFVATCPNLHSCTCCFSVKKKISGAESKKVKKKIEDQARGGSPWPLRRIRNMILSWIFSTCPRLGSPKQSTHPSRKKTSRCLRFCQIRFLQFNFIFLSISRPRVEEGPPPLREEELLFDDTVSTADWTTVTGHATAAGPDDIPGSEFSLRGTFCLILIGSGFFITWPYAFLVMD